MKLLQIGKVWFDKWTSPQVFPINLNDFVFTQIWLKLFAFAQIYLRLLDPNPNAPILLKRF